LPLPVVTVLVEVDEPAIETVSGLPPPTLTVLLPVPSVMLSTPLPSETESLPLPAVTLSLPLPPEI
jgi:hypothetical protein